MTSSNAYFKSIAVRDTKTIVLSAESGIVTYKAVYENLSTKQQVEMFVTTVYARIHDEWKGVFYQQTLLDTAWISCRKITASLLVDSNLSDSAIGFS